MHLEIFIDFTLIGANRQDRSRDMNIENILFFLDSLSPFFSEKYIRLSKTEKLAFVTNIWNATAWSLVFILRTFLKLGFLNTMYVIKLKEILQLAQVPMMKTSKKKHWTCHFSSPLPWKYCFSKPTSLIHSDLSTSKMNSAVHGRDVLVLAGWYMMRELPVADGRTSTLKFRRSIFSLQCRHGWLIDH